MTNYIAAHFFGLQSEIVHFGYSLHLVLYSARSPAKFDIHRTFFLVYRVKKSSLIILYLILYSAHDKNLTYIVDFSSLQSEKSQL